MAESDLRTALERANVGGSHSLPAEPRGNSVVEQLERGSMLVQRLPIKRVDIKVEVAAFIDHHFMSRTVNDGTVLVLSKETLVEELTTLFHSLEQRSSDIDSSFRKKAPPKKENSAKTKVNDEADESAED